MAVGTRSHLDMEFFMLKIPKKWRSECPIYKSGLHRGLYFCDRIRHRSGGHAVSIRVCIFDHPLAHPHPGGGTLFAVVFLHSCRSGSCSRFTKILPNRRRRMTQHANYAACTVFTDDVHWDVDCVFRALRVHCYEPNSGIDFAEPYRVAVL